VHFYHNVIVEIPTDPDSVETEERVVWLAGWLVKKKEPTPANWQAGESRRRERESAAGFGHHHCRCWLADAIT
jgi:hypothetical protein